jgi:hypothetical protein
MRSRAFKLGIYLGGLLICALLAIPTLAGDKKDSGKQTLTGIVSDSMCGAKHMMPGDPVECAHGCLKQGSKYALVVGEKVYTLETGDKSAADELDSLIGKKAKVTGAVSGETIQVSSVSGG